MKSESRQTRSEPGPENGRPSPDVTSPQSERSSGKRWIIIAAVSVAALCLCATVCAATFGGIAGLAAIGAAATESEKAPVESVLDAFMKSMAAKDFASAHALLSPRAQPQIPVSDLQELANGSNYGRFKGYESLSIYDINVSFTSSPDPRMPQGQVAVVTATTSYDCGCQGTLEATLEKVDGNWLLDAFYVTVPPEMLQP